MKHWLSTVSLAAVFGFLIGNPGVAGAQPPDPDSLPAAISISERSTDNRSPYIATSSDGSRVAVVWDGVVAGSRRIIVRERVNGVWLPEQIVDSDPAGDSNSAVAAFDSMGNPHVAWLSRTASGSYGVQYAMRVGNQWIGQRVRVPEAGNCEEVSLVISGDGQPWVAWQEGSGLDYGIYAATMLSGQPGFLVSQVCDADGSLNLYPQVLEATGERVRICWYEADGPDFALRSASCPGNPTTWQMDSARLGEKLPAERLPRVVGSPVDGSVSALWFERMAEGDRLLLLHDLGSNASVQVAYEGHDGVALRELAARSAPGGREVVGAWASDSDPAASQITGFIASSLGDLTTTPLSGSIDLSASRPSAAALGGPTGQGLVAVWESSPDTGGNGLIYFAEVEPE